MCRAIFSCGYKSICFIIKMILFLIVYEYFMIYLFKEVERYIVQNHAEHFTLHNLENGGSIVKGITITSDSLSIKDVPWDQSYHIEIEEPAAILRLFDVDLSLQARIMHVIPNNKTLSSTSVPNSTTLDMYKNTRTFAEVMIPDRQCTVTKPKLSSNRKQTVINYVYSWLDKYVPYVFSSSESALVENIPNGIVSASLVDCIGNHSKLRIDNLLFTSYSVETYLNNFNEENHRKTNYDIHKPSLLPETITNTRTSYRKERTTGKLHFMYGPGDMSIYADSQNQEEYKRTLYYENTHYLAMLRTTRKDWQSILHGKNAAGTRIPAGNVSWTLQEYEYKPFDELLTGTLNEYEYSLQNIQFYKVKLSNIINIQSNIEEIIRLEMNTNTKQIEGQIKVQGYTELFEIYHDNLDNRTLPIVINNPNESLLSIFFDTHKGLLANWKIKLSTQNEYQQNILIIGDLSMYIQKVLEGISRQEFPIEATVSLQITIIDESTPSIEPIVTEDNTKNNNNIPEEIIISESISEAIQEIRSESVDETPNTISESEPLSIQDISVEPTGEQIIQE